MADHDTIHDPLNSFDKLRISEHAQDGGVASFAVPELLEHILGFLPFKDLLFAQAISKTFQATIAGSLKLRQKLYLDPDLEAELSVPPIVPHFFKLKVKDRNGRNMRLEGEFDFSNANNGLDMHSWRHVLITQPPTDSMMVCLGTAFGQVLWGPEFDLYAEGGITLGMMADHARRLDPQMKQDFPPYDRATFGEKQTKSG